MNYWESHTQVAVRFRRFDRKRYAAFRSMHKVINIGAAGIDVRQRGEGGTQADISIRGGTFDQIAVLLNGVNLSNPQTGHYSFDLPVNLSDIERIEVVSGPSSFGNWKLPSITRPLISDSAFPQGMPRPEGI